MLKSRLIPCLLIHEKGLVKTRNFKNPIYIGDPINTIKIFNEKNVDEIFIADIDATVRNLEPNYDLISKLAIECRMPLCFGGGIKTIDQALKIIELGVEKVALSSIAIKKPNLVSELALKVGNQSVVVVMDIKKTKFNRRYELFTNNGRKATGIEPLEFALKMEKLGVGEIIINSIDKDGTLEGFDFNLINQIVNNINIPFTVIGGASKFNDFKKVAQMYHPCGIGA